jgi:hypothetical protein
MRFSTMVNFSRNNAIVEGNMSSTPHFQVHTALLAMKSTGPKEAYVVVSVGTVGEILDGPEKLNQPGFVKIRVQGEALYTFARDLQDNALIESLPYDTYD